MATKQPAQSPPQKPRNVRAIKKCYVGDALRDKGDTFVYAGELGTCLVEVAADEVVDPEAVMEALTKGKPIKRTQRSGTHDPSASDDDEDDDDLEDEVEDDDDGDSED
jgi:hypothetical protein